MSVSVLYIGSPVSFLSESTYKPYCGVFVFFLSPSPCLGSWYSRRIPHSPALREATWGRPTLLHPAAPAGCPMRWHACSFPVMAATTNVRRAAQQTEGPGARVSKPGHSWPSLHLRSRHGFCLCFSQRQHLAQRGVPGAEPPEPRGYQDRH